MNKLSITRLGWAAYGVCAAIIAVDQLSKTLAVDAFRKHCPEITEHTPALGQPLAECSIHVSPLFSLTMVMNHGMSFGLFRTDGDASRWLLTIFAVAVAGFLAWAASRTDKRLFALAAGCLMGGALGNVVDRFRFGAVVDFLDFKGLTAGHFPWIFNIADSAITVGAVLLLWEAFLPSLRSWLASRKESGN